MSRPRKSAAEHELTGSKPRYTLPDGDVIAGRPKAPKSLSDNARKTFRRLAHMLQQRRHLSAGDQEIISLFCIASDRHQRALEKLAEEGEVRVYEHVAKGEIVSVEKENLWYPIARDAAKFMKSCLGDLGLNPVMRNKVKTIEKPKSEEDELPTTPSDVILPTEEINLDDIQIDDQFGAQPEETMLPETRALLDEIAREEEAEKCNQK